MPKQLDSDKLIKINRILGIAFIAVTILLLIFVNWKAALACVLVGVIYVVGFFFYMDNYSKKFIKAYKAMGMTKDMYVKQLRKSGTDVKNVERMARMWDKVKED